LQRVCVDLRSMQRSVSDQQQAGRQLPRMPAEHLAVRRWGSGRLRPAVVLLSLALVAITVVFGAGGGTAPAPTIHDVPASRPPVRGVPRDLHGLGGGGVDRW